ncbi:MAG: FG-GAP-like repeat-containing protein [Fidelibacterota bacterium]
MPTLVIRVLSILLTGMVGLPPVVLAEGIIFSDISIEAGIIHSISGEGVCIFDYDGDGWSDILVADFNGQNLLYHNLGDMTFEEVSAEAGLATGESTRLVLAGDYDNDGDVDLFMGVVQNSSLLFRNNGDGTFTDVTTVSGIYNDSDIRGGAWCDFNNDGSLDLYLANLHDNNRLYQNNNDGTFTDVATELNALGPAATGLVMGLAILDFDGDHDSDIFMTQDGYKRNFLLRKESSGNFSDYSEEAGIDIEVQGMGVACGDVNGDGWFDVYTTNLDENSLFLNQGDGTFLEIEEAAGAADEAMSMSWGVFFFDADNDGWLDIFSNNQSGFGQVPSSFFHNLGDGTFEELSNTSGLELWNDGIGCAYGDLDNDGDIDLFLAGTPTENGSLHLLRNDSAPANWIQFTLEYSTGNTAAISSLVHVYSGNIVRTSFVSAGDGYCSQNTLRQHFGLGSSTMVDSVIIIWSGGETQVFGPFSANQHYLLSQEFGGISPDNNLFLPQQTVLYPLFPNPFNSQTNITFALQKVSNVDLTIYDLKGQVVKELIRQSIGEGIYKVKWKASDVPTGLYVVVLSADNRTNVQKVIHLK